MDPWRFGRTVTARQNPALAQAAPAAAPAGASAFTASIAAMTPRLGSVQPMRGELKDGLQALSDRNAQKARAIREGMVPGSLDRHILSWAIGLTGGKDVPAAEIARTATELADLATDELLESVEMDEAAASELIMAARRRVYA